MRGIYQLIKLAESQLCSVENLFQQLYEKEALAVQQNIVREGLYQSVREAYWSCYYAIKKIEVHPHGERIYARYIGRLYYQLYRLVTEYHAFLPARIQAQSAHQRIEYLAKAGKYGFSLAKKKITVNARCLLLYLQ